MADEPTAPSFGHMPTEFPSEAAAKVGRAILARKFTLDLIEPVYDLIGYGLRQLLGETKPVFGSAAADAGLGEDAVGALLVDAAEPGDGRGPRFAAGLESEADGVGAVPWAIVLPILFDVVKRIIDRRRDK